MNDIIAPLTVDEHAVLMIAAGGNQMIDLGEHSKWSVPIQSLIRKGFLKSNDRFNNEVTAAGRQALADFERAEDAELADAINRVRAPVDAAPVGPVVSAGHLFFKMPDGSSISMNVGEPYASQIVEMWRLSRCGGGGDDNAD
jgi:hypothetical protein